MVKINQSKKINKSIMMKIKMSIKSSKLYKNFSPLKETM